MGRWDAVKFVYVVSQGEYGEGTTPVSAHITLPGTKAFCKKHYNAELGKVINNIMIMSWLAILPNGVDRVLIHRLPVKG